MTLPQKSRRTLTVDGVVWHWIAKSEPILIAHDTTHEVHVESRLVIERADTPGRRIVAVFDSRAVLPTSHRSKFVDFPALTPALVRAVITHALASGWDPQHAPGDFALPHADTVLRDAFARAVGNQRRMHFAAIPARVRRS